jgi:hypothetical protein
VAIWLFGAFCFLMAFIPQQMSSFDWKTWFVAHKTELILFGLIFLLAAAERFYKLGQLPRVIDGDEGLIGMFAQSSISNTLVNPFALWENIGALYLQAINLAFLLFGTSAFSLRLLPAIAGTLSVLTTYLLARQIAGKRVALLSVVLLAISHTHIHFSRTVAVSYIQGTWLGPLELFLFLSGLEKRSYLRTALAGILLAVHFSIYLSAQMFLGILTVYMLITLIKFKDSIRPAWRQVLVFWSALLFTFIPEGVYLLRHPGEFLNRMNADGTFNSGWLTNEILTTGKSSFQILAERVIHAFLSLIYYPAIDFYGSSMPMLSLISSTLFIIGMVYAIINTRSNKFLLLNGYFWGATVLVGVFAVPPSADSYRMLVALPPALIMAAMGLDQILIKFGIGWRERPIQYLSTVTVVIVSLMAVNMWTYYFDFIGQCRFGGDRQTRFASYLGSYVRTVETESEVYLLSNDVFRYGSHASVDFLAQQRKITNLPEPISTLSFVSGEVVIANPDRIDELRAWVREHPGGEIHFQNDCNSPMLMAYQIP